MKKHNYKKVGLSYWKCQLALSGPVIVFNRDFYSSGRLFLAIAITAQLFPFADAVVCTSHVPI